MLPRFEISHKYLKEVVNIQLLHVQVRDGYRGAWALAVWPALRPAADASGCYDVTREF